MRNKNYIFPTFSCNHLLRLPVNYRYVVLYIYLIVITMFKYCKTDQFIPCFEGPQNIDK